MAHTLYKIYYSGADGDFLAYLGRTNQPLNSRLRGHFFKRAMHRSLDARQVSKVEYAELPTVADMYLYEIYYINKFKPPFNCDDKAKDELTVSLPEIEFKPFDCKLLDKWCRELESRDKAEGRYVKENYEWVSGLF